jgi:ParB family chromosome partitioning protein
MPVIVKRLSRDDAVILMGEANRYRQNILPSEKARTYLAMATALGHKGKRSDLLVSADELNYTADEITELYGDSKRQVWRYIRLTKLIPDWLDLVDKGNQGGVGKRQGVELSYLDSAMQKLIYNHCMNIAVMPSHAQTIKIREKYEEGILDEAEILKIIGEQKPNQIEHVSIRMDRIGKFFPEGTKKKDMEDVIVQALELWRKRERNRQREV